MHEMPFVMSLLREASEAAAREGLTRITGLTVSVGALSGIEPECVDLYFETASEGTPAEGARITYRIVPAGLCCKKCGTKYDYDPRGARRQERDPFLCPVCGGDGVLIRGTGTETTLESLTGE